MPIKSYLLIPTEGLVEALQSELKAFPQCEVTPSENKNVIILLTDTVDAAADKELFNQLLQLDSLKHINLVSAFSN